MHDLEIEAQALRQFATARRLGANAKFSPMRNAPPAREFVTRAFTGLDFTFTSQAISMSGFHQTDANYLQRVALTPGVLLPFAHTATTISTTSTMHGNFLRVVTFTFTLPGLFCFTRPRLFCFALPGFFCFNLPGLETASNFYVWRDDFRLKAVISRRHWTRDNSGQQNASTVRRNAARCKNLALQYSLHVCPRPWAPPQ